MNDISFGINKWQACTSYFEHLPDQQLSVDFGSLHIAQDLALQPSSVKPMLRRRLSRLGKYALWCADQVLASDTSGVGNSAVDKSGVDKSGVDKSGVDKKRLHRMPCVFASQHGEVGRTTDILESYANSLEISPTAFSLSVHNAIAGIYSIANGLTGNISAIAAGDQSLVMGLLEAGVILHTSEAEQVLCVIYDQVIPEKLKTGTITPDFDFAIALLLDKTSPLQLTLNQKGSMNADANSDHPFIQFIRFLLQSPTRSSADALSIRHWQLLKQVV